MIALCSALRKINALQRNGAIITLIFVGKCEDNSDKCPANGS